MRVSAKPFRDGHLDCFQSIPESETQFKSSQELLVYLGTKGQCCSFFVDGRILFVGGWAEAAPGVAEAFIYPSIWATRYPKSFYAEAKWWVQNLKSQHRRVQCWGEDTELSKRWLKHLGFRQEGVLLSYAAEGKSMLVWGIT